MNHVMRQPLLTFCRLKLEYSSLADLNTHSANLWADTLSAAFSVGAALPDHSGDHVSIEGVFVYSQKSHGYLGGRDGEIKRVTRIKGLE